MKIIDRADEQFIDFEEFYFSGGEYQIVFKDEGYIPYEVIIDQRFTKPQHIVELMMTVDALRGANPEIDIYLFAPYIPYARQDKREDGEALGIKVFADLINSMNFKSVTTFDNHSEVATALINRCKNYSSAILVNRLEGIRSKILICPDGGARKKCNEIESSFAGRVDCDKRRDTKTGKLSGFEVHGSLNGEPCIIVDDICDGGGTFLGLAEELKKKGAGDIDLVVTHGIFSKGTAELSKVFKNIYCSDSLGSQVHNDTQVIHITSKMRSWI